MQSKGCPLLFIDELSSQSNQNDLSACLKEDSISLVCVSEKIVVVGSNRGTLYVFDHLGNLFRQFSKFNTSILNVDVDLSGDYVAFSSAQRKVLVLNITDQNEQLAVETSKEPTAVAIHPEYWRKNCKSLLVGVGNKILHLQRSWINDKQSVVYVNEDSISIIRWRGRFVSWVNNLGADVYDFELQEWIGHVDFLQSNQSRRNSFLQLQWRDDTCLMIATSNFIKICFISRRKTQETTKLPKFMVELAQEVKVDLPFIGACFLKCKLVCLVRPADTSSEQTNPCVFEATATLYSLGHGTKYEEDGSERILVSKDSRSLSSVRMVSLESDAHCLLVFSKNVYSVKPRTSDDIIDSLLAMGSYEEAFMKVRECRDSVRHSSDKIALEYARDCLSHGFYSKAADIVKATLSDSLSVWEQTVKLFMEHGRIDLVAAIVPCSANSHLDVRIHGQVLVALLKSDQQLFCSCLRKWPKTLYDVDHVLWMIDGVEQGSRSNELLKIQAFLFLQKKNFAQGFVIYIKLKDPKVFSYIVEHSLFVQAKEYLTSLVEIDESEAIRFFVNHVDVFDVSYVVDKLCNYESVLDQYLTRVSFANSSLVADYADLQVKLHLKYSKSLLLPLLKESSSYDVMKAISLCKERGFFEEYAYLCERIGNHESALKTYISSMNDVHGAVSMCNRLKDPSLWDLLVNLCSDDSEMLCKLLMCTQHNIDAEILIKSIRSDMVIECLKETIVNLFSNNDAKISLMESCRVILESDSAALVVLQLKKLKVGVVVDVGTMCHVCNETIVVEKSFQTQNTVVFMCSHTFHSLCLVQQAGRDDYCPSCGSASVAAYSHADTTSALGFLQ